MENELSKSYYKIKEVAELLDVAPSTLRFWENEFPEVKPRRSDSNRRYYTPADIETLRIIRFLLKDKGLKIDAARQQLRGNRKNITKNLELIAKLEKVKGELRSLMDALGKRNQV